MLSRKLTSGFLLGGPLAVTLAVALVVGNVLPGVLTNSRALLGQVGGGGQCSPTIVEYQLPTSGNAGDITAGPDGNIWFIKNMTPQAGDKIGRVTPSGDITEFTVPQLPNSSIETITDGPDGNVWFTDPTRDRIGRITTDGIIDFPAGNGQEFPLSRPAGITAGPDGKIWFTELVEDARSIIYRMSPDDGAIEVVEGADFNRYGIIRSPDGNVWFTEVGTPAKLGKIATDGSVTLFPLPEAVGVPPAIAADTNGNVWFTYNNGRGGTNKIGKMTVNGTVTEYPILSANARTQDIAAAPDGNIWFTVQDTHKIGRITQAGEVTEYDVPAGTAAVSITVDEDGNVWFAESPNKIGKLSCAEWGGVSSAAASSAGAASSAASSSGGGASSAAGASSAQGSSAQGSSAQGSSASARSSAASGHGAAGDGDICTPICGDSLKVGAETCDDGNTKDGDGCSSFCKIEFCAYVDVKRGQACAAGERCSIIEVNGKCQKLPTGCTPGYTMQATGSCSTAKCDGTCYRCDPL